MARYVPGLQRAGMLEMLPSLKVGMQASAFLVVEYEFAGHLSHLRSDVSVGNLLTKDGPALQLFKLSQGSTLAASLLKVWPCTQATHGVPLFLMSLSEFIVALYPYPLLHVHTYVFRTTLQSPRWSLRFFKIAAPLLSNVNASTTTQPKTK